MKDVFAGYKELIEAALKKRFEGMHTYPEVIYEAMAYSVLAGGKRFRPNLCLAACEAVGGDIAEAIDVACALEMIHTYSLIHDDLPSMDDDDYRRGKLTSHKVFGEAIALLAGDALLTYGFEMIAEYGLKSKSFEKALSITHEVAKASGVKGMIGGQVVDILSNEQSLTKETLHFIHNHKTGDLIVASIRVGGILGGANHWQLDQLTQYGLNLGLAFQITDDILDVVGDEEKIGKPVGSDAKNNKVTFPGIYGMEMAQKMVRDTVETALGAIGAMGASAPTQKLEILAQSLINREV